MQTSSLLEPAPSTQRLPTVLVGDRNMLSREGMKRLVGAVLGDAHYVEVADGDALLRALAAGAVRLALIDPRMPGMDEGQRLADLAHRHPGVPLVVVSALTSPDAVRRTLRIPSVHAYVAKNTCASVARAAIEDAFAGRKQCAVELPAPAAPAAGGSLTPRQHQIRALLGQGLSNKHIASVLGISTGTVKNHITEIFRVLNTTNRTQAAAIDVDAI